MSVRLSARISAAPTRQISVKFDIGGLYENVWKLQNWLITGKNTTRFKWRPKYVLSLPSTLNHGRNSSVGIVTRYGLDGPGMESRCGRDFSQPSSRALGPTQSPVQWVPGHALEVKRPGRVVDRPRPPSVQVTERVEPYLYSPSGLSWLVTGWSSPSTVNRHKSALLEWNIIKL